MPTHVAGRPAPSADDNGWIEPGHLGLRVAAEHPDAPDAGWRIFRLSGLESRRPLYRFPNTEGHFVDARRRGSKPQPLTETKKLQYPWSFTPDGKRLSFMEVNAATGLIS